MLLRELRVLCVSVVKLLGPNFLFRSSGLTTDRLRQGFLLRRLLRLGYEGQEGFGGQDDGQVALSSQS